MLALFDNIKRDDTLPSKYLADSYDYLNLSAREDIHNIRNILEKWFSKFPEDEKPELKSRFQSTAFQPALFELFIYNFFTELGYQLTVHPSVVGTGFKPDYLAKKGESEFYIEVKHLMLRTQDGLENMKNSLYDTLNKVDSPNFFLWVYKVVFKGTQQPRGKNIIKHFNNVVRLYDPDIMAAQLQVTKQSPNLLLYEDDKVIIEYKLMPISNRENRHRGARFVGCIFGDVRWGGEEESIKSALEKKGSKYGHLNKPFLVCLNQPELSFNVLELQVALYGNIAASYTMNTTNRNDRLEFAHNGFYGSQKHPRNQKVSAVLGTRVNISNLFDAEYFIRHHIKPHFPFEENIQGTIRDILKIPDNYPNNHLTAL